MKKAFNLILINFLLFVIFGTLVEVYFNINQSYLKKNLHLTPSGSKYIGQKIFSKYSEILNF